MSEGQFITRDHGTYFTVHAPTFINKVGRVIAVVESREEAERIRKKAAAEARRARAEEQRK